MIIKKLSRHQRPDSGKMASAEQHRQMLRDQLEALKKKASQAMIPKTPEEEQKVPFEESTNQTLNELNRPKSGITKITYEGKSMDQQYQITSDKTAVNSQSTFSEAKE